MTRDTFLRSAAVAAGLLHDPALAARWADPSALPDFSVGGLTRHLAYQILGTPAFIAAPPGSMPIPVLEHYTRNTWLTSGVDSADNVAIRGRGESAAAGTTAVALAAEVDAALAELRRSVPAEPGDRIVDLGDWALTLDDLLLTRILELVVHGDDLAVSIGVPTPEQPSEATSAVIHLLADIAAWRNTPMSVVRAFARRERAPESIAAL